MFTGVAVLCLLAILSSAMLVLFLQRQRKARGGKKLLRWATKWFLGFLVNKV